MRSARFILKPVDFTPFDAAEAAKIPHFDTYNRTAASQRVTDIVEALRATPDAVFVGSGDAALAGLLALAIETGRRGDTRHRRVRYVERRRVCRAALHAGSAARRRSVHRRLAGRGPGRHPQRRSLIRAQRRARAPRADVGEGNRDFAESGDKVTKNEKRKRKTKNDSFFRLRFALRVKQRDLLTAQCGCDHPLPSACGGAGRQASSRVQGRRRFHQSRTTRRPAPRCSEEIPAS